MGEIRSLGLDDLFEVRVPKSEDARGLFSERWSTEKLVQAGIAVGFVQDNQSFSGAQGVMRVLHF